MSALTKVSEKDLPHLYCMKMKICYDNYMFYRHRSYCGNAMTPLRGTFSRKSPEGACLNSPVSNSSQPLNGSTEDSFNSASLHLR